MRLACRPWIGQTNQFVTLGRMAYDSTATKERILAAATAEYAAHGVAGARVDRFAAEGKPSKHALYD